MNDRVILYDTTLRDGTQREGLVVSLADKINIARRLDEFGMAYVEGGWPGSNPKDVDFFAAARSMAWKNAKLAAFGSTRHRSNRAETDPNLVAIVAAGTTGGLISFEAATMDGRATHELFHDATARNYVRLTVSDTGCGMAEEKRQRISNNTKANPPIWSMSFRFRSPMPRKRRSSKNTI